MQIQNSERFFVIGLSCIVDNGLCSALASSHCARNPYVAFFIQTGDLWRLLAIKQSHLALFWTD